MPANLTLKFQLAERAYRRATTPREELECLQRMLTELPKHKGTDKMQADLKQRISQAKRELSNASGYGARKGFRLPRQGAGRVVIIGGPNAGKSQLLATLTNAKPEIADYPFTTREPQPGMMPWQDIKIQLVDTPAITADVFSTDVQALIRGADLVLLMLDLGDDDGGQQLQDLWNQLESSKSRLDVETKIDEQLIGVTFTQCMFVINKIDLPEAKDRLQFFSDYIHFDLPTFKISALEGTGIETLKDAVFESLDVVRVYTKMPNKKEPDMDSPLTLRRGQTVLDLAKLIHKDIADNFKSARVWGEGVHPGTQIKEDYQPNDRDIIELNI